MANRHVKRVPLDFDFPVDDTWSGYLMGPELDQLPCPECAPESVGGYGRSSHGELGDGRTREARAIDRTFYPHMIGGPDADALAWCDKLGQAEVDHLVAEGRLRELREVPEDQRCGRACDDAPEGAMWAGEPCGRFRDHDGGHFPRPSEWVSVPRSAAEVNAANRRPGLGSHDAINRHILVRFRCERVGIEPTCPRCEGEGAIDAYPGQTADREAWTPTEPPAGDGYQLWQTISEGGPCSPVFPTAGELADWLTAHQGIAGGSLTREEWLRLFGEQAPAVDVATGRLA